MSGRAAKAVLLLAVAAIIWVGLSGCGSKINQDNFNRIQVGMTYDEVKAILGPATESSSVQIGGLSGTSAKWVSKTGAIQIQFLNDRVKIKQFTKS